MHVHVKFPRSLTPVDEPLWILQFLFAFIKKTKNKNVNNAILIIKICKFWNFWIKSFRKVLIKLKLLLFSVFYFTLGTKKWYTFPEVGLPLDFEHWNPLVRQKIYWTFACCMFISEGTVGKFSITSCTYFIFISSLSIVNPIPFKIKYPRTLLKIQILRLFLLNSKMNLETKEFQFCTLGSMILGKDIWREWLWSEMWKFWNVSRSSLESPWLVAQYLITLVRSSPISLWLKKTLLH